MSLTRAIHIFVVVIIAAGFAIAHPAPRRMSSKADESLWPKFTGKDEEFSVRMPRQPWLYVDLITSQSGKRTSERIYSTYSKGAVYLVVSYDGDSLKGIFENFKLRHCSQAEVTFVRDKALSGYAGKEYSLKFGDVIGILNVYVTNKHGYAVATVQAKDDARLRDYFLSTFSLSKVDGSTGANSTVNASPPESSELPEANSSEIASGGGKQVTRKPVVVSKPEPWYSDDARRANITGTVVLRVVFSSSGEVTNIHVVRGLSKGLTENAIDAAKHLTFIPAIKDGRFVSHWIELQYNFGLY